MELLITDEDRAKYGSIPINKNVAVAIKEDKDRFSVTGKPIDTARIPTVADLRLEGKLSEESALIVSNLSEAYPKVSFDNITPSEAVFVAKYSEVINGMTREQIWKEIKPFFSAVFNTELGDVINQRSVSLHREH